MSLVKTLIKCKVGAGVSGQTLYVLEVGLFLIKTKMDSSMLGLK